MPTFPLPSLDFHSSKMQTLPPSRTKGHPCTPFRMPSSNSKYSFRFLHCCFTQSNAYIPAPITRFHSQNAKLYPPSRTKGTLARPLECLVPTQNTPFRFLHCCFTQSNAYIPAPITRFHSQNAKLYPPSRTKGTLARPLECLVPTQNTPFRFLHCCFTQSNAYIPAPITRFHSQNAKLYPPSRTKGTLARPLECLVPTQNTPFRFLHCCFTQSNAYIPAPITRFHSQNAKLYPPSRTKGTLARPLECLVPTQNTPFRFLHCCFTQSNAYIPAPITRFHSQNAKLYPPSRTKGTLARPLECLVPTQNTPFRFLHCCFTQSNAYIPAPITRFHSQNAKLYPPSRTKGTLARPLECLVPTQNTPFRFLHCCFTQSNAYIPAPITRFHSQNAKLYPPSRTKGTLARPLECLVPTQNTPFRFLHCCFTQSNAYIPAPITRFHSQNAKLYPPSRTKGTLARPLECLVPTQNTPFRFLHCCFTQSNAYIPAPITRFHSQNAKLYPPSRTKGTLARPLECLVPTQNTPFRFLHCCFTQSNAYIPAPITRFHSQNAKLYPPSRTKGTLARPLECLVPTQNTPFRFLHCCFTQSNAYIPAPITRFHSQNAKLYPPSRTKGTLARPLECLVPTQNTPFRFLHCCFTQSNAYIPAPITRFHSQNAKLYPPSRTKGTLARPLECLVPTQNTPFRFLHCCFTQSNAYIPAPITRFHSQNAKLYPPSRTKGTLARPLECLVPTQNTPFRFLHCCFTQSNAYIPAPITRFHSQNAKLYPPSRTKGTLARPLECLVPTQNTPFRFLHCCFTQSNAYIPAPITRFHSQNAKLYPPSRTKGTLARPLECLVPTQNTPFRFLHCCFTQSNAYIPAPITRFHSQNAKLYPPSRTKGTLARPLECLVPTQNTPFRFLHCCFTQSNAYIPAPITRFHSQNAKLYPPSRTKGTLARPLECLVPTQNTPFRFLHCCFTQSNAYIPAPITRFHSQNAKLYPPSRTKGTLARPLECLVPTQNTPFRFLHCCFTQSNAYIPAPITRFHSQNAKLYPPSRTKGTLARPLECLVPTQNTPFRFLHCCFTQSNAYIPAPITRFHSQNAKLYPPSRTKGTLARPLECLVPTQNTPFRFLHCCFTQSNAYIPAPITRFHSQNAKLYPPSRTKGTLARPLECLVPTQNTPFRFLHCCFTQSNAYIPAPITRFHSQNAKLYPPSRTKGTLARPLECLVPTQNTPFRFLHCCFTQSNAYIPAPITRFHSQNAKLYPPSRTKGTLARPLECLVPTQNTPFRFLHCCFTQSNAYIPAPITRFHSQNAKLYPPSRTKGTLARPLECLVPTQNTPFRFLHCCFTQSNAYIPAPITRFHSQNAKLYPPSRTKGTLARPLECLVPTQNTPFRFLHCCFTQSNAYIPAPITRFHSQNAKLYPPSRTKGTLARPLECLVPTQNTPFRFLHCCFTQSNAYIPAPITRFHSQNAKLYPPSRTKGTLARPLECLVPTQNTPFRFLHCCFTQSNAYIPAPITRFHSQNAKLYPPSRTKGTLARPLECLVPTQNTPFRFLHCCFTQSNAYIPAPITRFHSQNAKLYPPSRTKGTLARPLECLVPTQNTPFRFLHCCFTQSNAYIPAPITRFHSQNAKLYPPSRTKGTLARPLECLVPTQNTPFRFLHCCFTQSNAYIPAPITRFHSQNAKLYPPSRTKGTLARPLECLVPTQNTPFRFLHCCFTQSNAYIPAPITRFHSQNAKLYPPSRTKGTLARPLECLVPTQNTPFRFLHCCFTQSNAYIPAPITRFHSQNAKLYPPSRTKGTLARPLECLVPTQNTPFRFLHCCFTQSNAYIPAPITRFHSQNAKLYPPSRTKGTLARPLECLVPTQNTPFRFLHCCFTQSNAYIPAPITRFHSQNAKLYPPSRTKGTLARPLECLVPTQNTPFRFLHCCFTQSNAYIPAPITRFHSQNAKLYPPSRTKGTLARPLECLVPTQNTPFRFLHCCFTQSNAYIPAPITRFHSQNAKLYPPSRTKGTLARPLECLVPTQNTPFRFLHCCFTQSNAYIPAPITRFHSQNAKLYPPSRTKGTLARPLECLVPTQNTPFRFLHCCFTQSNAYIPAPITRFHSQNAKLYPPSRTKGTLARPLECLVPTQNTPFRFLHCCFTQSNAYIPAPITRFHSQNAKLYPPSRTKGTLARPLECLVPTQNTPFRFLHCCFTQSNAYIPAPITRFHSQNAKLYPPSRTKGTLARPLECLVPTQNTPFRFLHCCFTQSNAYIPAPITRFHSQNAKLYPPSRTKGTLARPLECLVPTQNTPFRFLHCCFTQSNAYIPAPITRFHSQNAKLYPPSRTKGTLARPLECLVPTQNTPFRFLHCCFTQSNAYIPAPITRFHSQNAKLYPPSRTKGTLARPLECLVPTQNTPFRFLHCCFTQSNAYIPAPITRFHSQNAKLYPPSRTKGTLARPLECLVPTQNTPFRFLHCCFTQSNAYIPAPITRFHSQNAKLYPPSRTKGTLARPLECLVPTQNTPFRFLHCCFTQSNAYIPAPITRFHSQNAKLYPPSRTKGTLARPLECLVPTQNTPFRFLHCCFTQSNAYIPAPITRFHSQNAKLYPPSRTKGTLARPLECLVPTQNTPFRFLHCCFTQSNAYIPAPITRFHSQNAKLYPPSRTKGTLARPLECLVPTQNTSFRFLHCCFTQSNAYIPAPITRFHSQNAKLYPPSRTKGTLARPLECLVPTQNTPFRFLHCCFTQSNAYIPAPITRFHSQNAKLYPPSRTKGTLARPLECLVPTQNTPFRFLHCCFTQSNAYIPAPITRFHSQNAKLYPPSRTKGTLARPLECLVPTQNTPFRFLHCCFTQSNAYIPAPITRFHSQNAKLYPPSRTKGTLARPLECLVPTQNTPFRFLHCCFTQSNAYIPAPITRFHSQNAKLYPPSRTKGTLARPLECLVPTQNTPFRFLHCCFTQSNAYIPAPITRLSCMPILYSVFEHNLTFKFVLNFIPVHIELLRK